MELFLPQIRRFPNHGDFPRFVNQKFTVCREMAPLPWAALREHGGDPFPALLTLLSQVEDTNLLYRGGTEGLAFVQREAAAILAGPPKAYIPRLEALDAACVQRNLSPGGCADLLALGLLLYRTEALWIPEIAPAEEPQ